MAINVQCSCGKSYRLKDEYAGRQAKCSCGRVFTVTATTDGATPVPQRQNQSKPRDGGFDESARYAVFGRLIEEGLETSDTEKRSKAVNAVAMLSTAPCEKAVPLLFRALQTNAYYRRPGEAPLPCPVDEATRILLSRKEEFLPHLIRALGDNYCQINRRVAVVLAKTGDARAIAAIGSAMMDGSLPTNDAAFALSLSGLRQAVRPLVRFLEERYISAEEKPFAVTVEGVVRALAKLGDEQAIPPLKQVLEIAIAQLFPTSGGASEYIASLVRQTAVSLKQLGSNEAMSSLVNAFMRKNGELLSAHRYYASDCKTWKLLVEAIALTSGTANDDKIVFYSEKDLPVDIASASVCDQSLVRAFLQVFSSSSNCVQPHGSAFHRDIDDVRLIAERVLRQAMESKNGILSQEMQNEIRAALAKYSVELYRIGGIGRF